MAPQRAMKFAVRRAYKASGLDGQVRLAFSECLGPCSESNVLFVYLRGEALWFRRMNTPEILTGLLDYLRKALDDRAVELPPALRAHSFSWTGGGIGPEPPLQDVEAQ